MPTYEYHCLVCEADFEEKYPFDQIEEHPPCPICSSKFTKRGVSSFAFFTPGQGDGVAETSATSTLSHGPDCLCCYPRPKPKRPARSKSKTALRRC